MKDDRIIRFCWGGGALAVLVEAVATAGVEAAGFALLPREDFLPALATVTFFGGIFLKTIGPNKARTDKAQAVTTRKFPANLNQVQVVLTLKPT